MNNTKRNEKINELESIETCFRYYKSRICCGKVT